MQNIERTFTTKRTGQSTIIEKLNQFTPKTKESNRRRSSRLTANVILSSTNYGPTDTTKLWTQPTSSCWQCCGADQRGGPPKTCFFFQISHTRAKYVNNYHGWITQKHRYLRGKNIALKKGVIYIQSPAQIRSATAGSCRAFDWCN